MIVAPARINVSSQLGREENVASLAMLHVTARMVGGHSGWLEVGWKLGALSCCACKTWRRWRLRAVVRAVMLSDCCAGGPCRDAETWAAGREGSC